MLPLILVAVGAYLIGDSVLEDKKYAKGGKTQGYDDKEDERLAMEHGKMAKKDLDSTHARRDDARFEERGKMAKGGYIIKKKDDDEYVTFNDNNNSRMGGYSIGKNEKSAKIFSNKKDAENAIENNNLELHLMSEFEIIKMAKGGKLVGKQKNLDVNKNGKLDAEDFKMLRKGK